MCSVHYDDTATTVTATVATTVTATATKATTATTTTIIIIIRIIDSKPTTTQRLESNQDNNEMKSKHAYRNLCSESHVNTSTVELEPFSFSIRICAVTLYISILTNCLSVTVRPDLLPGQPKYITWHHPPSLLSAGPPADIHIILHSDRSFDRSTGSCSRSILHQRWLLLLLLWL